MHAEAGLGAPQRPNTNLFLTDPQRDKEAAFHVSAVSLMNERCHCCDQQGHDMFDCSTLKNLNALAKANGISWEWGATKGAIYYDAWIAANQEVHFQQQLEKARKPGKFYKRF